MAAESGPVPAGDLAGEAGVIGEALARVIAPQPGPALSQPGTPQANDDLALSPCCAFLAAAGFPVKRLQRAMQLARMNGTSAGVELLAHGAVSHDVYYRTLAARLGLAFVDADQVDRLLDAPDRSSGDVDARTPLVWCQLHDGRPVRVTAPDPRAVGRLVAAADRGTLTGPLAIATPRTLRDLVTRHHEPQLLENAIRRLAYLEPAMSAHSGARFWQGVVSALVVTGALVAFASRPGLTTAVLHGFMSVFFFACVLLRALAAVTFRPVAERPLAKTPPGAKPVYTVLVCLYREAAVIPDLIASLKRINWPRSKLQILLVCEHDDAETLAALATEQLPPFFEIVRVPPAQPRTKPKALNYAMAFARGQFVTLYDAEDRPHPDQLEEAWQTFARSDEAIACLQAPLVKANTGRNALTALFHLEYAGLFGGLMPWLARAGAPIMLGGTSNHFRRDALEKVGRWDPFNVTEDADLGMRLWRSGYRTAMITRPTLEDAPSRFADWLPQRTRWFKGWMQTWIVHTREPLRLLRNMDARAFLITQLLLTGTVVSALLYPLVLVNAAFLSAWLLIDPPEQIYMGLIAWLDWLMILSSYVAVMTLGWIATDRDARGAIGWRLLLVPAYWLAQSVAAWRAVHHLFTRPFEWEKTPHGPHERP
ncbi:glycosyltransferase [Roseitalea porphyridii]|uniref:Glycosyltransferase n=2 Tax=Roseitalea porphyridii TaxID=1852022 RepID=A0A4V1A3K7_9HYPH|nr:glycosyltransferase [Roseitalea porphyridii]